MRTRICLLFLAQKVWMIIAVVLDMEAPMTSSWLEGDWSTENLTPEEVTEDKSSGCICRSKLHEHVVCYGTTTCFAFPRDVILPEEFDDFRLKTTAISSLQKGDFYRFTSLKYLEIDANSRLSFIEPGIFSNLSLLTNLSISFNSDLKYLRNNTFIGLVSLTTLRLIKNGFQNVLDVSGSLSPNFLPELKRLSLSENVFKEINELSFAPLNGTNIQEFDLLLCQIEKLEPASLRNFQNLDKLRLGENLLREETLEMLFGCMVNESIPLSLLNLYEVGLRKGPKLTSLLKVISKLGVNHLNLRRNHIETIYEGLFPYMPHLRILDLREVSALDIEPNALNQILMPKLEVLLLGGNKLSGVMPGVLLPQLFELDLSVNSGSAHFPSYFDVNSNFFENMTNLESLNMSFNRIATISNETFNGVHNLRILGLKNATIFYIAENSFVILKKLFLLNLEDNPFHPFNTFPNHIFEGLENLEILLLSGCKITHFTQPDIFKPLKNLKYLSLKDNSLLKINPLLFESLPSLIGLDLSWNQLKPWAAPNRLFPLNPNLKVVLLSNNRFTYLTRTMMDDVAHLTRLDLSSNPFVCDCMFFNRTNSWLYSRNLTLNETNLLNSLNTCVSPDEWRDKSIIQFLNNQNDNCNLVLMKTSAHITYILLGTFCLFIIVVIFLGYYYRWHIRYWMFLSRMFYWQHYGCFQRKRKVHPNDYAYDVFVSYSHEDRNFIVRLVAMLENYEPFLKLCVYERDFEIGSVISETVMEKVATSRKTLLVVSDAFAKSQWCMWELQLAEYHRLFFKSAEKDHFNDTLIIIKLGYISNAHMTPTLRYLLKTRIYLEWSPEIKKQKMFWEKLRNSLSPPEK